MGVAGTWLTSQVAYDSGGGVLDEAARRRVAPYCDQLLSLSQNTFRTATGRLTTRHRARLSPDHADCLAFLNKNLDPIN